MRTTVFIFTALFLSACSSADFTVDTPIGLDRDGEAGDAGGESGAEGGVDTGVRMEVESDSGSDSGDTGTSSDTGSDTGVDTGTSGDTGGDTSIDTSIDTGAPDAVPVEKCSPAEAPTSVAGDVTGGSPSTWSGSGEMAILVSLSELDKVAMKDLRGEVKFAADATDARFELQVYRGARKTLDGKMPANACVGAPEALLSIAGGPSTKTTELVVTDIAGVYDEQVFTLWVRPTGPTSPSRVWQVTVTGNK